MSSRIIHETNDSTNDEIKMLLKECNDKHLSEEDIENKLLSIREKRWITETLKKMNTRNKQFWEKK